MEVQVDKNHLLMSLYHTELDGNQWLSVTLRKKNTLVFLNAESRRQTGTRSKAFVLQRVIYWTFSFQHCLNVAISVPGWKQGLPGFLLSLTICQSTR